VLSLWILDLGRVGMRWWVTRGRTALSSERGAEVPEYVLVVAIIAMLAVVGLVAVKNGLLSNLNGISSCLQSTAGGSATACQ
jgi:Flp pilus assembly pilin Flp